MKVFSESFTILTSGEFYSLDLTQKIDDILSRSCIDEGIACVFAGHATGVIVITEYEPRLMLDIQEFLKQFIPKERDYNHPVNAFAHLRSMILTPSKIIPVHKGRLALGTWQSIVWIEAEVRSRNRTIEVIVIGSTK